MSGVCGQNAVDFEVSAAGQDHMGPGGAGNHVVDRDDDALGIHDEAAALSVPVAPVNVNRDDRRGHAGEHRGRVFGRYGTVPRGRTASVRANARMATSRRRGRVTGQFPLGPCRRRSGSVASEGLANTPRAGIGDAAGLDVPNLPRGSQDLVAGARRGLEDTGADDDEDTGTVPGRFYVMVGAGRPRRG